MSTDRDAGLQALQQGNPSAAAPLLEAACQQNPNDFDAYLYLGAAYGQIGRQMDAINTITRAVQLQPGNAQARYNLGVAMEQGGYRDQAVTALQQALTLQPEYPKAQEALRRLQGGAAPAESSTSGSGTLPPQSGGGQPGAFGAAAGSGGYPGASGTLDQGAFGAPPPQPQQPPSNPYAPAPAPNPYAPTAPNPYAPGGAPNPYAPAAAPNPYAPGGAPNPYAPSPSAAPYAAQAGPYPYAARPGRMMGTSFAPVYGGFWLRFGAYILDSIILVMLTFIPGMIVGVIIGSMGTSDESAGLRLGIMGLYYIVILVGTWLYFALQESSAAQATLGKRAVGVIVTDMDGQRIGFARATGRYFGKILSSFLAIGFIMVGVTEKKQGLHDLLASTLVVRR